MLNKNNRTTLAVLALILICGAVLRFWNLGEYSLWVDEPQVYAAAQSITETGLPYFHSGHLYTRDLPHLYLNAASMLLFGENEFAIRFVSALAGLGIIVISYFIALELWNRNAGLFAAALTAFHPWLVSYSRISRSYILVSLLILIAAYATIRYVREKKLKYLLLLIISGGLSIMTHQTGQTVLLLYIPLFVIHVLPAFQLRRFLTITIPFIIIFSFLIAAKYFTSFAYYNNADQHVDFVSNDTFLDKILSYIPVQVVPHFEYIFFIENPAFLPFFSTVIFISIGIFAYKRLRDEQRVFLLLMTVLLGILVFSRKAVRVNRAVMYISPLLMVSLAICSDVISVQLKRIHRYIPAIVGFFFIAGIFTQSVSQVAASYGDPINEYHSFFEGINYRVDMKTTFEYVNEHIQPGDQVIVIGSPKFATAYMDVVPDYYVWTGTQITIDDGYHYVVKTKLLDSLEKLKNTTDQKNTWVITTYSMGDLPRVNHISSSIRRWINNKESNLVYQSEDPYARVYYLPTAEY